jgi:hypothetical protein
MMPAFRQVTGIVFPYGTMRGPVRFYHRDLHREPFMTSSLSACLAVVLGLTIPTLALAADGELPLGQEELQTQFRSGERTYFREHRLRAYERTRADTRQGATCVTPKGVCWIGDPLPQGDSCSCQSRRLDTMTGTVGG